MSGAAASLVKLLYWLGILLLFGYLGWRYREQIRDALKTMLNELRALWDRLFGRSATAHPVANPPSESLADTPRPFSDFQDPFGSDRHRRLTPQQLVRYTFEALEAWGREIGSPRSPCHTPHEFTRALAARLPEQRSDMRLLAQLYCRVAYADGRLPAETLPTLRRVWQQMTHA